MYKFDEIPTSSLQDIVFSDFYYMITKGHLDKKLQSGPK